MTDSQKEAYEWLKEHSYYRSKGVRCALELVSLVDELMSGNVEPVVRCGECKHQGKNKCPLVTVRFDVKPNGKIRKVLEQNYVRDDFWCKEGER